MKRRTSDERKQDTKRCRTKNVPNSGGRLALPKRSRIDPGTNDVVPVRRGRKTTQSRFELHLGLGDAPRNDFIVLEADFFGYVGNGEEAG